MIVSRILAQITERQISDDTRLRRVVAIFQRQLGAVFGNASVKRRNRRYEIDVAVYETAMPGGRAYRMPDRQVKEWVRQAAEKAHPRLFKRLTVRLEPWRMGHASQKMHAPLKIFVDANQDQPTSQESE